MESGRGVAGGYAADIEILIDNRNGNVWDISAITTELSWKTGRIGKAATLEFSYISGGLYESRQYTVNPGDLVRVAAGGLPVFFGYVFSLDSGRDVEITVVAYDQVRYLMASDICKFTNSTATDIIRHIASEFQLPVGELADTRHVIPRLIEDNTKLLDVICKALDHTLVATGQIYVFYDDFGKLALRNLLDMRLNLALGEESLLYDYDYKRSIDSKTYNYIKLSKERQPQGESGGRFNYTLKDSETISRWGRLQLFKKVDDKLNEAQIKAMADNLIALHNREERTLQLEALGNWRVRAGCSFWIELEAMNLSQMLIVEECTHKRSGRDHTMTLEVRGIE